MARLARTRIWACVVGLLVVGGLCAAVLLYTLGGEISPRAETARVLGFGTFGPDRANGLALLSLPGGTTLARLQDLRGQVDALAITADHTRAYLLDEIRLLELDLPSLSVVRIVDLPDAIQLLGSMDTIAVAPDGQHVYVETTRIVGPQRWDPQLRVGQPDSRYGVTTYDVAQARFTGEIELAGPWCGGADLMVWTMGALCCGAARHTRCGSSIRARALRRARCRSTGRVWRSVRPLIEPG